MRFLSCHQGRLIVSAASSDATWATSADPSSKNTFTTGLSAIDELLPNSAFARGAIHELLVLPHHPSPLFVSLLLARAACFEPRMNTDEHRFNAQESNHEATKSTKRFSQARNRFATSWLRGSDCLDPCSSVFIRGSKTDLKGAIVWSDPLGTLYPPAVAAMGVPLERLFLLRPTGAVDENWAVTEALRCRGVAATVVAPRRISRVEARRFQLAAERGGGIGLFIRPYDRSAQIYSAATRWLIAPHPGERTVQRWKIQLIHAHGGRVGQTVILEHHRDTSLLQAHPVRQAQQLAHRPLPTPARKTA